MTSIVLPVLIQAQLASDHLTSFPGLTPYTWKATATNEWLEPGLEDSPDSKAAF